MQIRKITEADVEVVKEIYSKAFDFSYAMQYLNCFDEYMKFCMTEEFAYIAGDEEGDYGIVLGYVKPDMYAGKTAYIDVLGVVPEKQSQGYGSALLNKIFEVAQSKGITNIGLKTNPKKPAYEIYKKMGFLDMLDNFATMEMSLKSKGANENEQ